MSKSDQIDYVYRQKLSRAVDAYITKMGKRISDQRLNDCYRLKALIESGPGDNRQLTNSYELSEKIRSYLDSLEIGYFARIVNRWVKVTGNNTSILYHMLDEVIDNELAKALSREINLANAALEFVQGHKIIEENRSLRSAKSRLEGKVCDLTNCLECALEKNVRLENKNQLLESQLHKVVLAEKRLQENRHEESRRFRQTINELTADIQKLESAVDNLQRKIFAQQKTIESQQNIISVHEQRIELKS